MSGGPGLSSGEERQGATSGAPPRQAVRHRTPEDARYGGPGAKELPDFEVVRPKATAGVVARLWYTWTSEVVPACFKHNCISLPERPQFNAQVWRLIKEDGLSEEEIADMMVAYAGRLNVGQVNVTGKSAWGVFLKTWPKLRGRASDSGLQAAIEGKALINPEDWTTL